MALRLLEGRQRRAYGERRADAARGAGDQEDGVGHRRILRNYSFDVGRFSMRITKRSPDHVSSIAQTLLSTRPSGRPTSRSASSVRSLSTPELFLGQAIQSAPAGSSARASFAKWRSRSAREVVKKTTRSSGARTRLRTSTRSGSCPSVRSNPSGAPTSASRAPSFTPSFFGSGVLYGVSNRNGVVT